MTQPQHNAANGYTWDDYRSWDDGKLWEIIDGKAYDLTPSPPTLHQMLIGNLMHAMNGFFKGRHFTFLHRPLDVKLSDTNIVQPDILVVGDRKKVQETHIEGAPDLVVEIISEWTAQHDRLRKMSLYARFGVKEFWLATPEPPLLEVYVLREKQFTHVETYGNIGRLNSPTYPDLNIDLSTIFESLDEFSIGKRFLKDTSDPYALMKEQQKGARKVSSCAIECHACDDSLRPEGPDIP